MSKPRKNHLLDCVHLMDQGYSFHIFVTASRSV